MALSLHRILLVLQLASVLRLAYNLQIHSWPSLVIGHMLVIAFVLQFWTVLNMISMRESRRLCLQKPESLAKAYTYMVNCPHTASACKRCILKSFRLGRLLRKHYNQTGRCNQGGPAAFPKCKFTHMQW